MQAARHVLHRRGPAVVPHVEQIGTGVQNQVQALPVGRRVPAGVVQDGAAVVAADAHGHVALVEQKAHHGGRPAPGRGVQDGFPVGVARVEAAALLHVPAPQRVHVLAADGLHQGQVVGLNGFGAEGLKKVALGEERLGGNVL